MSPNVLALLPEIILTLAGVLIMLADPLFPAEQTRKPLGWLAILGTLAAGLASWYQLGFGTIHAYYGTIQVDSFSVFFHLLIAAIVLVTLLSSLDYFEGHATHAGEYFALVLFGATGMMLMTCSVELLMVFVGLEISSISTYIMAGFRKGQAAATESSIKYFLLGSFATAFFLYGIALAFGSTGSTRIDSISLGLSTTATPTLALLALALIIIGIGFKVSAAPSTSGPPTFTREHPPPSSASCPPPPRPPPSPSCSASSSPVSLRTSRAGPCSSGSSPCSPCSSETSAPSCSATSSACSPTPPSRTPAIFSSPTLRFPPTASPPLASTPQPTPP